MLRKKKRSTPKDNKFGTFPGVFTPTILTILGAIMYLRLGWVVGNAGLAGAIVIILLAHLITICTGLAVSSISTNTKVGAGGAFAIISQSLGLEIGGSVGVPLYFAQGISVALYVLAFQEGFVSIFTGMEGPWIPFVTNVWLVAFATFAIVLAIAYISAQFAARIQYLIMAIIILSLVSIFLAIFPSLGGGGLVNTPQIWGEFNSRGSNFWGTFAVYFPAVTGIMSGISMSGSLRDPRRSIPVGTMGAIFVGLVVYLVLSFWLARIASPEELLSNNTVMVDKALWGWAILAGMLGATFSSALGSLVAAPRVLQALAENQLVPGSKEIRKLTKQGEPRQATVATALIAFVALIIALLSGGLDAVAGVITMFFLIAYAMLNVVVLIEQTLDMVSFRPIFSIPRIIPFIGMVGCIFVMFLIDPIFTIVAIVVVLGLYAFLARRNLETDVEDVRSGLFSSVAEWATIKSQQMPSAPERSWKPTVLVPVTETQTLTGSYRFLLAMTHPKGAVYPLGIYPPGKEEQLRDLEWLNDAFQKDGVYARATLLEKENFFDGVRAATQILRHTFFRPNILFFNLRADSNTEMVEELIGRATSYRMGIVLLARHPVIELGREQIINVWLQHREEDWETTAEGSNLHLLVLLAMQLAKNWNGQINLCTAVKDLETSHAAQMRLEELVGLARLPQKSTRAHVIAKPFRAALQQAPRADLSIFGLANSIAECQQIIEWSDGSCVFVRDSGEENTFA